MHLTLLDAGAIDTLGEQLQMRATGEASIIITGGTTRILRLTPPRFCGLAGVHVQSRDVLSHDDSRAAGGSACSSVSRRRAGVGDVVSATCW